MTRHRNPERVFPEAGFYTNGKLSSDHVENLLIKSEVKALEARMI